MSQITPEANRAARFFIDLSVKRNRNTMAAMDAVKKGEIAAHAAALQGDDSLEKMTKDRIFEYVIRHFDLEDIRRQYAEQAANKAKAEMQAEWPEQNTREVFKLREELDKWQKSFASNPAYALEHTPTEEAAEYSLRLDIRQAMENGTDIQGIADYLVQKLFQGARSPSRSTNSSFNEMEDMRLKAVANVLDDLRWTGVTPKNFR